MSGLFNSTKLKNCNFFSLRDWKFIWNIFNAGGGDGVVFGSFLWELMMKQALSGECKALKLFTGANYELRSEAGMVL